MPRLLMNSSLMYVVEQLFVRLQKSTINLKDYLKMDINRSREIHRNFDYIASECIEYSWTCLYSTLSNVFFYFPSHITIFQQHTDFKEICILLDTTHIHRSVRPWQLPTNPSKCSKYHLAFWWFTICSLNVIHLSTRINKFVLLHRLFHYLFMVYYLTN